MKAEFKLTVNLKNDVLVMETEGYVNNDGGETIVNEFDKHAANGIKKVIISLEKSKVVNSIGISFLIEVIEKLNDVGGKLIFTNLDPSIDKTLSIMGLFSFAEKSDTIGTALKAF